MLTDDHPKPPPAASPLLAGQRRRCLHCDYPLTDRPIGTICPECGNADRRACAVCGSDLAELSEDDRCQACGTPVRDALAQSLLTRLPPKTLRRIERATLLLCFLPPLAVGGGLLASFVGLGVLKLTLAITALALPIAVLVAAVIPRGMVLPRSLPLFAWGARAAAAAALAFALGVVLALDAGADASAVVALLVSAGGVMLIASGLHAAALVRKRAFAPKPLLPTTRDLRTSWPWALAAVGLAAMFALMSYMGGVLCVANLAGVLIAVAIPVFAWAQWLTLGSAARSIRQAREAALPPPPPTRTTPDSASPDPS